MKQSILIFSFLFFNFYLLKSQTGNSLKIARQLDSLIDVSIDLTTKANFEGALAVNAEAKKIAIENFGDESSFYARICFQHANTLYNKKDYQEAMNWCAKAKAIQEKTPDKNEYEYAEVHRLLGVLHSILGDFEKAESNLLESLVLKEKIVGKENSGYIEVLNSVGAMYLNYGNYENAEAFFLEAIALAEKVLGKNHPQYAKYLNNLGSLYVYIGSYEKAEPLLLEVSIIGKQHSKKQLSICLYTLGLLYYRIGPLEKAEHYYLEAKILIKEVFGQEHSIYSKCLSSLGGLYSMMGNYKKAETLLLESLEIRENTLGKNHASIILMNLGVLYQTIDEFEKAEKYFKDGVKTARELLGENHEDYARAISSLGNFYINRNELEKAEPLLLESLAIIENTLGKDHRTYASGLWSLAKLYHLTYSDEADATYLETKSIYEKTLGKEHVEYLKVALDFAYRYDQTKRFEDAELLYLENSEIVKSNLYKVGRHLSENELSAYVQLFSHSLDLHFSFAQRQSRLIATCYDNALFYKGFLINGLKRINRLTKTDSISTALSHSFKSYQRRLAAEYTKPIIEQKGVIELEGKANMVEKKLIRHVAQIGQELKQVSWEEVQSQLNPEEVSIEFIHYQFRNPLPTDSIMYAAMLIHPDKPQPQFIPLFEEKSLNSLIKKEGARRAEYVNNLYSNFEESLYKLIWKPLEKELKDVKAIYYSPSGLLHQINLNAIPISENNEEMLSEKYQLQLLNSTRELVVRSNEKSNNFSVALFGGIQYDEEGMTIKGNSSEPSGNISTTRSALGFNQTDSTLRGGHTWQYLESTKEETESLIPILEKENREITLQKSYSATEESFKVLSKTPTKLSPSIIHVATHGYFFPDPNSINDDSSSKNNQAPVFKISEHPMIRSGLLFAGANHAWQTGKPIRPTMEDGILTAYEISQMDLSDTELVVLSACETGLGDIKGNEGVYGLQRAFKIAGVKNIIMSLWQVPDYQTKELMIRFYKNYLEKEMDIQTALLSAQNSMRDEGYEPFHWAGFVVLE